MKADAFKVDKWKMCCQRICHIISKKDKNRSLQAQAAAQKQKKKRASAFASCRNSGGSATVETVLVFPVFLCAVSVFLMMGQCIVTEGKIQHAVAKTAGICSGERAIKKNPNVILTFHSVFDMSSGDRSCIAGDEAGIQLSLDELDGGERIRVKAVYRLRISVLFLGTFSFDRRAASTKRVFCGYTPHGTQEGEEDQIVYVTDNGTVYHTSLSCSHICLKISGESVGQIIKHSGLAACEKCIKKGEIPSRLYITVYGECFHSSLNCSGLKRSVRAVRLSEVKNMRMCTRCALRESSGK